MHPVSMAEHRQLQPQLPAQDDSYEQQAPYTAAQSAHHKVTAQHSMQHMQHAHHAAGGWCAGPMLRSQLSSAAVHSATGVSNRHGSPAHTSQHAHPSAQQLPAAYSRLSIAGDTVADAQRQTDQCMAPPVAAGAAEAQHAAAWPMQRAGAGQGSWAGAAGQDVDAAKLKAQADQHMQGQALSVEVSWTPQLHPLP